MTVRPLLLRLGALTLALACATWGPVPAAAEGTEYQVQPREKEAWELLMEGKPLKARDVAEQLVREHPDSFVARLVLGEVYAWVEGSLPRAYGELTRARATLEKRYGVPLPGDAPWMWHVRVLRALASVAGQMDRPGEELALLEEHDRLYQPDLAASHGWPLMKAGRIDEARRKMRAAAASTKPLVRFRALNTLGAIEAESDHPEETYRVFQQLLADVRASGAPMEPEFLRNAGEAALTLLRFDEAERLYLEATRHFLPGTNSQPWESLAFLYIEAGRFPEAVRAVQEMHAWSHRNLPALDQQTWADRQGVTATLLLEGGMPAEAVSLLRRVRDRPDRRGSTTEHVDQAEASTLFLLATALRVHREALAEEASWSGLADRLRLAARRAYEGVEMWSANRRAAALSTRRGGLAASVRPLDPRGVFLRSSHRQDLVRAFGPGLVAAEAERLLARTGATPEREKPYLLALLGEARLDAGSPREALGLLETAAATLPRPEALLRARVEALRGMACEGLGKRPDALAAYGRALALSPAVVRHLGLALPVRFSGPAGGAAGEARRLLSRSPRFRDGRWGFLVELSEAAGGGAAARLLAPDGTVLAAVRANPAGSAAETARSLAREVHRRFFAPRVDLSQVDIRSLEGSNLTGEGIREELQDLFGGGER